LSHFRYVNHTESRYNVNITERGTYASKEGEGVGLLENGVGMHPA
jgi:hypothetical protein